jgi:hypothetical protein
MYPEPESLPEPQVGQEFNPYRNAKHQTNDIENSS